MSQEWKPDNGIYMDAKYNLVYPEGATHLDGIPEDVRLTWDLFDDRITRVPASATDEAGAMPAFLTPDDPELHWVNYLKGDILPREIDVAGPDSHLLIPLTLALAVLLCVALLFIAARRRSWLFGLAALALLVAGWFAPRGPTVQVSVPASLRAPSGEVTLQTKLP